MSLEWASWLHHCGCDVASASGSCTLDFPEVMGTVSHTALFSLRVLLSAIETNLEHSEKKRPHSGRNGL